MCPALRLQRAKPLEKSLSRSATRMGSLIETYEDTSFEQDRMRSGSSTLHAFLGIASLATVDSGLHWQVKLAMGYLLTSSSLSLTMTLTSCKRDRVLKPAKLQLRS
jgi:hypothetical protein